MEADLVIISQLLGYIFIGICLVLFVIVPFARLIDLFVRYWHHKQQEKRDDDRWTV